MIARRSLDGHFGSSTVLLSDRVGLHQQGIQRETEHKSIQEASVAVWKGPRSAGLGVERKDFQNLVDAQICSSIVPLLQYKCWKDLARCVR